MASSYDRAGDILARILTAMYGRASMRSMLCSGDLTRRLIQHQRQCLLRNSAAD